jgi:AP-1 complex subunit gamma-1
MGRVLAPDVASQLGSSNSYVRKKAALAFIRILKRMPELAEDYIDCIVGLLKDRSHGVLLTAVQLIARVISLKSKVIAQIVFLVPSLVKMLRNLLNLGYSPEHDISGIADPFLQVKLLHLLALLGQNNNEASEAMNDVLAQVATNTEANRNAGNAILYECVRAITTVESEAGLKILAVNILGRFLLNRDNNIRYVALSSLSKVVNDDILAVQRHRATVLECLKDPDISIRQRALELTYQLVNSENVEELIREMLNYLVVAAPEHRPLLCSRVCIVVERFAPSPRWQVETLIAMLSIAGNHCNDRILCMTVGLVTKLDGLHSFATHKLFRLLRDELPMVQIALMHVALWCVGEYGDYLLSSCDHDNKSATTFDSIPLVEILGLLEAVLRSHLATTLTKSYVLTALMKLANRLSEVRSQSADLISHFNSSLSLELHQRSCEFLYLLDSQWGDGLSHTFAKMPPVQMVALRGAKNDDKLHKCRMNTLPDSELKSKSPRHMVFKDRDGSTQSLSSDLLDLTNVPNEPRGEATPISHVSDVDLLSDIFTTTIPPAIREPTVIHPFVNQDSQPQDAPNTTISLKVLDKDGLMVTMDLVKDPVDLSSMHITCKFFNYTDHDLEKFLFQAAVPKYVNMEIKSASANSVPAHSLGSVTQVIKVKNPYPDKTLKMLLKVQYIVDSRLIIEHGQVPTFPQL